MGRWDFCELVCGLRVVYVTQRCRRRVPLAKKNRTTLFHNSRYECCVLTYACMFKSIRTRRCGCRQRTTRLWLHRQAWRTVWAGHLHAPHDIRRSGTAHFGGTEHLSLNRHRFVTHRSLQPPWETVAPAPLRNARCDRTSRAEHDLCRDLPTCCLCRHCIEPTTGTTPPSPAAKSFFDSQIRGFDGFPREVYLCNYPTLFLCGSLRVMVWPYESCKNIKGWPPQDVPSKLVKFEIKRPPRLTPWPGKTHFLGRGESWEGSESGRAADLGDAQFNCGTDHFHLTSVVRWKWKNQLDWVIKPVPHDLVRRIRFWRIKISGTWF